MIAHSIVLLALLFAAMPAMANKYGVSSTPAADTRENDDEEQEDIGDDAGLITDEFSYTYLFDQSYGVIAGFGKSSPFHLMHLEGFAFLRDKLSVSMEIGYGIEQNFHTEDDKHKHIADTVSLSAKVRYYLPLLPLSANASCGYVFFNGFITPDETDNPDERDKKHNYKSSLAYLGVSLSVYYFWKTGIYIESVIFGLSRGKSLGLKTDADAYKGDITEDIESFQPYGFFSGINLAVGYML